MIESETETQLDRIEKKIDRLIAVLEKVEPHLHLLDQVANNPAARFAMKLGKR